MKDNFGIRPVAPAIEFSVFAAGELRSLVHRESLRWGAVYVNGHRGGDTTPCVRGDRVRFHDKIRRFCGNRPIQVVSEHDDWIAVDKPAGLPVHGTCDNAVENLVAQLSLARGETLWACHRLDMGTSGLVILARNLEFRRHFGEELTRRNVQKRYEAFVSRPLPIGEYRHFQPRRLRAPYAVQTESTGNARECLLRILECHGDGSRARLILEPITGRQHQIRAQLAFLGAPIVGDVLYGAEQTLSCAGDGEVIALRCTRLAFVASGGRSVQCSLDGLPRT